MLNPLIILRVLSESDSGLVILADNERTEIGALIIKVSEKILNL